MAIPAIEITGMVSGRPIVREFPISPKNGLPVVSDEVNQAIIDQGVFAVIKFSNNTNTMLQWLNVHQTPQWLTSGEYGIALNVTPGYIKEYNPEVHGSVIDVTDIPFADYVSGLENFKGTIVGWVHPVCALNTRTSPLN